MTPLYLTANVQEAPRHDDTIDDDLRKIRDYVEHHAGGVVCWQELGNDHYRQVLAATFGHQWLHLIHAGGVDVDSPVSVDLRTWTVLDYSAEAFSPPIPGMQNERKVTWAHLRRKGTGSELVVSSRHYVARAWAWDGSDAPRDDPDERAEQPERQRIWLEGRDADLTILRRLAELGVPQLAAGDYNRNVVSAYPDTIHRQQVKHIAHGIDWLHFADGPAHHWRIEPARIKLKLHADHDAFAVHASTRAS